MQANSYNCCPGNVFLSFVPFFSLLLKYDSVESNNTFTIDFNLYFQIFQYYWIKFLI